MQVLAISLTGTHKKLPLPSHKCKILVRACIFAQKLGVQNYARSIFTRFSIFTSEGVLASFAVYLGPFLML